MIRTTTWRPDTCECVLEYSWDDATSEASRVHSLAKVVKLCPAHRLLGGVGLYDEVVSENRRKNRTYDTAKAQLGALDPEGWLWYYDTARVLQVVIPNLTASQKNQLQSACDTAFGAGKVKIN
ncbi:MAG: hypothetical protein KJ624_05510 [Chloroflexi bacterium]|nr:hypothetical protein [Chloroflexota bacterium]